MITKPETEVWKPGGNASHFLYLYLPVAPAVPAFKLTFILIGSVSSRNNIYPDWLHFTRETQPGQENAPKNLPHRVA